jgi:hypothetical protein
MEYLPAQHVAVVFMTNCQWADPIAAASILGKIAIS